MIEFGHGTHIGLHRTCNEDTYYADASLGLFLVADGMGGHAHGGEASALARDTLVEWVRRGYELPDVIYAADEQLIASGQRYGDQLPMGTTIAVLRIRGSNYELAWVGDSRIYLWHGHGMELASHDHALVQELVDAGRLDATMARHHPRRNVLTQALGITPRAELHIGLAKGRLQAPMTFLLCSDGFSEALDEDTLARTLARQELAAQECLEHLLLDALARDASDARDNLTAVLVRNH